MRSFARLLSDTLQRQGLTQSAFARKVGMSPTGISMIALGKRRPDPKRCVTWVSALGLRGAEAKEFADEMALAAADPRVQALVADLRSKLAP